MEQKTQNGRKVYPRPVESDQEIDPQLSLERLLDRRKELSAIIGEVEEHIASIDDQFNIAKQEQELTGELLNIQWVSKASAALRGYRRVAREHERGLKALNRRINSLRHKNELDAFVEIAQQMLEPRVFHGIWGRVRAGGDGESAEVA